MTAPNLTRREREALHLMVVGKSNKEIGSSLDVTEGTVKVHVNHILAKLGVTGRVEAIMAAARRGFVHLLGNPQDPARSLAGHAAQPTASVPRLKIYRRLYRALSPRANAQQEITTYIPAVTLRDRVTRGEFRFARKQAPQKPFREGSMKPYILLCCLCAILVFPLFAQSANNLENLPRPAHTNAGSILLCE